MCSWDKELRGVERGATLARAAVGSQVLGPAAGGPALYAFAAEGEGSDSDSDASSVEGGDDFVSTEEKRCCVHDCPHPVHEDFYDGSPGECRECYLCDACNRGFHGECWESWSAQHPTWNHTHPALTEQGHAWVCGECHEGKVFRIACVEQEVSGTQGEAYYVVRRSDSERSLTIISGRDLRASPAGATLLAHYQARVAERRRRGKDPLGKSELVLRATDTPGAFTRRGEPDTMPRAMAVATGRRRGYLRAKRQLQAPARRSQTIVSARGGPTARRWHRQSAREAILACKRACSGTVVAAWHQSAHEGVRMGACGADAGAFLDAVAIELEWWPRGDASDASDVWLPSRATRDRMTADQWTEWGQQWDTLVTIGEWARGACAKWRRFVARHADARVLLGHVRPVGPRRGTRAERALRNQPSIAAAIGGGLQHIWDTPRAVAENTVAGCFGQRASQSQGGAAGGDVRSTGENHDGMEGDTGDGG
jgi:hypothetical protein